MGGGGQLAGGLLSFIVSRFGVGGGVIALLAFGAYSYFSGGIDSSEPSPTPSSDERVQLVSFVLFAVTLHACIGMVRDRRPRWWLVPVFWLWACCHGLWIFGLLIGLVWLIGTWQAFSSFDARRGTRRAVVAP